jgi:hypothetical protein
MLHTTTLLLIAIISSSFLVAIPTAQTSNVELNTSKTFTIIAKGKEGSYIFEIEIESSKLIQIEQSITSMEINDITDSIGLTEEQVLALSSASSVRVMLGEIQGGDQSYIEIVHWFLFWGIPYGVYMHLYLSPADAINIGTALDVAVALLTTITAILVATIIGTTGAIVLACMSFFTLMIQVDYDTMYSADHNPDNSFDMWFDIYLWTYYYISSGWYIVRTPRYKWCASLLGAYIIETKPPDFIPRKGGGGGKAVTI